MKVPIFIHKEAEFFSLSNHVTPVAFEYEEEEKTKKMTGKKLNSFNDQFKFHTIQIV